MSATTAPATATRRWPDPRARLGDGLTMRIKEKGIFAPDESRDPTHRLLCDRQDDEDVDPILLSLPYLCASLSLLPLVQEVREFESTNSRSHAGRWGKRTPH